LPDKYNLDEAYDKVRDGRNASLDQMAIYGPSAKKLLTDEQIRKLPRTSRCSSTTRRSARFGRAGPAVVAAASSEAEPRSQFRMKHERRREAPLFLPA